MYSYEDRLKAVKLYIQYDKSYASVFRELGYPPSSHSIKLWYKEYQKNGDLHKSYSKTNKYSNEQRQAAIRYYVEHGRSKTRTVKALLWRSSARAILFTHLGVCRFYRLAGRFRRRARIWR